MPTQSHHGPTWVGPRAACRPPGREPWPHGVTAMVHLHRSCLTAALHHHTDGCRPASGLV